MNTALLGVSIVFVSISLALCYLQLPSRSSLVTLSQPSKWLQSAEQNHIARQVTGKDGEKEDQGGEKTEVILEPPRSATNATALASNNVSPFPKARLRQVAVKRKEQDELETTDLLSKNKQTGHSAPALIFSTQQAPSVTTTHDPVQTTTHPSPIQSTPTQLMPPPQRRASSTNPCTSQSSSTTLRIPTTGPLPNRGPPTKPPSTLLIPHKTLAPALKPSNPRQKVLLKPGHSPLDWAALTRSGTNLSGVPHIQRITPSQLAHNNGRKNRPAWSAWQGKVYNITPYLPFHPGGVDQLMRGAGKGAEKLFLEVHPWVNWENMLAECLVGFLVAEGTGEGRGGGMEEMD